MKKYIRLLCAAASAAVIGLPLCSCGNGGGLFAEPTPTPMPSADAGAVISLEDAMAAINNSYTLTLEGGAAVNDGNVSTASYISDPAGAGDPVIVKIVNRTESVTADDVWDIYENERISRESAKFVDNIGEDAYIAYPSIHIYDRGCEIVITAGSGADSGQKDLLESLGKTAVEHLNNIMPEVSDNAVQ